MLKQWHNFLPLCIVLCQVTYSSDVEWRSPEGVLVHFVDSGEATTTTNGIKISALVPGTTYLFRVSAIT